MNLVLDVVGWRRARLEGDDEARAWCDSRGRHGDRHTILRLELIDEGVLAVHENLKSRWKSDVLYTSGPCRVCDGRDFLFARRRYRGPVPPQVLAAFEASP